MGENKIKCTCSSQGKCTLCQIYDDLVDWRNEMRESRVQLDKLLDAWEASVAKLNDTLDKKGL